MRGQALCTTDLSEEVCVIAASTKSAAQGPSDVISICLQIAPTTPADPLLCFISTWAAVGGAVLLRRPKSMWNSAPALGLWGQWSVWRLLLPAVSSILSLHGTELETPHRRGKVTLVKYGPAEEEEGIWGTSTLGQWSLPSMAHNRECPVSWAPPTCAKAKATSLWYSLAHTWHPSVAVVVYCPLLVRMDAAIAWC